MNRAVPKLDTLIRESARLGEDLVSSLDDFSHQMPGALTEAECAKIGRVYIVGSGDSYHACRSAELAFRALGVDCRPMSSLRFLEYEAQALEPTSGFATLVVAVSASGRTERLIEAVVRARNRGALTFGITGASKSALTEATHRSAVVELLDREKSPGIRTFQANLVGLMVLAIRIGIGTGKQAKLRIRELSDLAAGVDETQREALDWTARVAPTLGCRRGVSLSGSGPGFGIALHIAAKLSEASGVFAAAQDLEEWWHIERFATLASIPLVIVATPGPSYWRAAKLASEAVALGRRVVVIDCETGWQSKGAESIQVFGRPREEYSPILWQACAGPFAAGVGNSLGRTPFTTTLTDAAPVHNESSPS